MSRGRRTDRAVGIAVLFWLAMWQIAALAIARDFLLAPPWDVVVRLGELMVKTEFWATVGTSLLRIALGFAAAAALGTVAAALAARHRWVDVLLAPLIVTIRSVPVVSFIILVLLWVDAAWLAAITSFLMVMPVMYTAVLGGVRHRDRQLLEAASVFEVTAWRRIRAIDIPAVLPFFVAASRTGVGLAWKSGVAAEVIGAASGSIGGRLYDAKIFLDSASLFAWTIVIVGLSVACERLVLWLLARGERRIAGALA
jgi:NitT/TauT family transport system permease protein